uniref:HAT C-terminal dimerisation domain-containing protein n=1 Tax=Fusarium oxysporum (strain Fo5176) TaxID=660025 RepID=A0A0C4DIP0_FUSOF
MDMHPRKSMGQCDDGPGKSSGSSGIDDMGKDHRRYLRLSIITAWQKLNEYYTKLGESPLFAASIILNPSLGMSYLEVNWASEEQLVWVRDAKIGLSDYLDRWYRCSRPVDEQQKAIVERAASPIVPRKTSEASVFRQWVKSRTAKTTAMGSELERYLRLEPQETEDPIEWWMGRRGQFPMVSQLALDILAIPAMATDCERSFSLAKLTLTSQRLSMTTETLEKLQCLKIWVRHGAVKLGATAALRIIETLWNAWKKEQQALKQMIEGQETAIRQLQQDIQAIQAQAAEKRKLMRSFADIARVLPTEGLNGGVRRPEPVSPPAPPLSSPGEDLFCMIDISGAGDDDSDKAQIGQVRQAIEAAVRAKKESERWRCAAVVRGARNANIIKVICRDVVVELHMVRQAVLETDIPGAKLLRERLYPVKINGANRSAVLDSNQNFLAGVTEAFGQENEVTIAKMNWLSDKGNGKAYGSMVVYVTKENDARRLLEDKYFHLGGESARTSVFEPGADAVQCYNCWGLGHKAFVCKEAQRCGRCAERGHHILFAACI